ncbi:MAG: hypothetical protein ABR540_09185 [Acidimicrobiales bacterium]
MSPRRLWAAVLGFTAVAFADAEVWGTVSVSVTSLEPGDAFVVSGMSLS